MKWSEKRVLVTGAGGFIGSHLAETLVKVGARTRALVHYNARGKRGWLDDSPLRGEMEVVAGDVCDRDSVLSAVEGVDVVFHLAALIAIPYSYRAPASYLRTNVEGTLNVLQAARDLGTECVVHTSTSETYGTAQRVPIDEGHPLQAQSPYAASKIAADKIAESFHLSFSLPVATVRPFNTFGPRQSARAVIPTIITQCLSGEPAAPAGEPAGAAGKIVRLGNLAPTRDMNFVANTVSGFMKAAATPNAVGRTINLGSGREIRIGDLANLIARLAGTEITIETDEQRVRPDGSEVERLLADSSLARELLGWEPEVGLEQGLELTIDWIREHLEEYRPDVYTV